MSGDERLPEFEAVVTPARTDMTAVRQDGDTRDKRETFAQVLSLIEDGDIAESAVTQHQAALAIVEGQITGAAFANWNAAFGWGNHAVAGYLTSETDPVFLAHDAAAVTAAAIANWNAAFGWGNHALAGYLTSFSEVNDLSVAVTWANIPDANVPVSAVTQHQAALAIASSQLTGLQLTDNADVVTATNTNRFALMANGTTGYVGRLLIEADISDLQAYLTSFTETDPVFLAHDAAAVTAAAIANWNAAFGWGDHAGAGYLSALPDPVLALNYGTAGVPAFSFVNDPDTGMFRAGSNFLQWTVGGTARFGILGNSFQGQLGGSPKIINSVATLTNPTFQPNGNDANTGIGGDGADILSLIAGGISGIQVAEAAAAIIITTFGPTRAPDGSAAAPAYSFTGAPTSGLFRPSADMIEMSLAGASRWQWNANYFMGKASNAPLLINQSSSATVPNLNPSSSDLDTGIGRAAADQLSLIAGGVEGIRITEAAAVITLDAKGSVVGVNGSASVPAFAFASEVNSGLYRQSAGVFMFSIGGSGKWVLRATSFDGNVGDGPRLMFEAATATNPVFVTLGDTDTGMGRAAADQLSLIAGGVEGIRVAEAAAVITNTIYGNLVAAGGGGSGPAMLNVGATATVPTFVPNQADPDTGIGRSGVDQLAMIAGGLQAGRFEDPADISARDTALWLYDKDNNQMEQVSVGDADSGGTGYKVLRILN